MVGSNRAETHFKVLKIDRTCTDLVISDESVTYDQMEITELLTMIHEGNKGLGGMKKVATAAGLLGTALLFTTILFSRLHPIS